MTEHVLIVGQGYVGLPLAMAAVDGGFDVTGLDLDDTKVKGLNAGESHIEDITDAQVRAALDSGRYWAVASIDDVDRFDIAVISVHDPGTFAALLQAVGTIAERLPILYPAHPRVRAKLEGHTLPDGIRLMEPAGYLDFVALQAGAALVLTDSGGLQEETTVLGVPCLTLRENTERPITIDEGTNQLAGTDPARIVELAIAILDGDRPGPRRPELWDGKAAQRIADAFAI